LIVSRLSVFLNPPQPRPGLRCALSVIFHPRSPPLKLLNVKLYSVHLRPQICQKNLMFGLAVQMAQSWPVAAECPLLV